MYLNTQNDNFRVLLAANSTSAAPGAPTVTVTEPVTSATAAVVDFKDMSANSVALLFFGAGADNATGTAVIYGWRRVTYSAGYLWVPTPLLGVDLVLSTSVGVAGTAIINTDRFADTITLTASSNFTSAYELVSNAGNLPAMVKLDHFGARKLEIRTAIGTATNLNVAISEV
jgi:hypothetical protein